MSIFDIDSLFVTPEKATGQFASNAPAIPALRDLPPAVFAKFQHLMRPANPQGADPDARLPQPTGWFVMALQYTRPPETKTAGGLILPDAHLKEDEYQGRVGYVIGVGPDAYRDRNRTSSAWVSVGDWIAWPRLSAEAAKVAFGAITLVIIPDEKVMLTNVDPDLALSR